MGDGSENIFLAVRSRSIFSNDGETFFHKTSIPAQPSSPRITIEQDLHLVDHVLRHNYQHLRSVSHLQGFLSSNSRLVYVDRFFPKYIKYRRILHHSPDIYSRERKIPKNVDSIVLDVSEISRDPSIALGFHRTLQISDRDFLGFFDHNIGISDHSRTILDGPDFHRSEFFFLYCYRLARFTVCLNCQIPVVDVSKNQQ